MRLKRGGPRAICERRRHGGQAGWRNQSKREFIIMQEREQKNKEESIQLSGTVTEEVRGAFRVKIDDMDHSVLCRLAGKMRKFKIRVVPGDRVTVEISPYDMDRGRITFRER